MDNATPNITQLIKTTIESLQNARNVTLVDHSECYTLMEVVIIVIIICIICVCFFVNVLIGDA